MRQSMPSHLQIVDKKKKIKKQIVLEGTSLFVFGPTNPIRVFCANIVNLAYFDTFILVMIFASTILLSLENPLDNPNGDLMNVLSKIDYVMTAIFTLESLLKIISYGYLFTGKPSYMRNPWNVMDFLIVVFSLISAVFSNDNLKIIKVFRMLRVLRPLRMISRNEGLKVAVTSIINSIGGIFNVMVISLLFFLLFGILGTNYFKGQFYHCKSEFISYDMGSYDILTA